MFSLVLLICGGVSAFDINDELEALKEPGLVSRMGLDRDEVHLGRFAREG